MSLFRNHSATLGYYICDDCCPVDANIEQVTLQAQLYNLVKSLDPLHLTYATVLALGFSGPRFPEIPAAIVNAAGLSLGSGLLFPKI